MAIADFQTYKTRLVTIDPERYLSPGGGNGEAIWSCWRTYNPLYDPSGTPTPLQPAIPTTSTALTNSSVGSLLKNFPTTGTTDINLLSMCQQVNDLQTFFIVCDRLVEHGGLVGNITTAQTTNLPTAALPRYTDGVGVMAFYEIYTTIGNTPVIATASYTNQSGTSGRTSYAIIGGNQTENAAGTMIPLGLQSGDTGFRSVESVTLSATTGTAGGFGITLVKMLGSYSCHTKTNGNIRNPVTEGMIGPMRIPYDTCLAIMGFGPSNSGNFTIQMVQE